MRSTNVPQLDGSHPRGEASITGGPLPPKGSRAGGGVGGMLHLSACVGERVSYDMGDCAAMTASPTGSTKMPKQETSEVNVKMWVNQTVWQRLRDYESL